jgi:hypothetical protein
MVRSIQFPVGVSIETIQEMKASAATPINSVDSPNDGGRPGFGVVCVAVTGEPWHINAR